MHIVEDIDIDFLSIIIVKDVYKKKKSYKNFEHVYVLEPSMNVNERPFLVQDDHGISKINSDMGVVKFFTNHQIDALVFVEDILRISYDYPLCESRATNDVNDHEDGYQPACDLNEDTGNEVPIERKETTCVNVDD